jgi:hypothetical protein
MAKPIKITPVLKGKDAISFYTEMESNKNKKVSASVIATIRNDAQKLKSLLRN